MKGQEIDLHSTHWMNSFSRFGWRSIVGIWRIKNDAQSVWWIWWLWYGPVWQLELSQQFWELWKFWKLRKFRKLWLTGLFAARLCSFRIFSFCIFINICSFRIQVSSRILHKHFIWSSLWSKGITWMKYQKAECSEMYVLEKSAVCVCIGHFTLTVAGWHSVWLIYTVQKI